MTDEENKGETPSLLERVSSAFSAKPKNREQLLGLLRQSHQNELLDLDSLRMIEGVMQVAEMNVSEIMIPRAEMIVVPKDATLAEILPIAIKSGHSRFPVIGENKDEVVGILLAKDLLNFYLESNTERFSIKEILRPVVFIPENKRLNILLNEFRRNRNHIAIIVDEYGGVSGLVSIEDVLEQIVGDIEDEHDIERDLYIRKHKDGYYSIKAITPIEEFNQFFNTQLKDNEFDTIGGLVLQGFGHLPKRGESIMIENIPFKVLRANSRRIQLLQTTLTPPEK
ncbi:transporter associated domain-containing protein [Candidatus Berkiella aquae]|uniref:Magnesium and cobalt efflux protein CorC n=1 Tax=Candidatus Berkiella aquae TaxID=295108 RepID=A0A0Q9YVG6_9GAMM|nr:transporter associated domain-containing protein [Candidatus Berkiella aquae]MCS5710593.1 CBS domain-containing protein [Candidatus Berkiella aquae]